jgi:hypothetical protein
MLSLTRLGSSLVGLLLISGTVVLALEAGGPRPVGDTRWDSVLGSAPTQDVCNGGADSDNFQCNTNCGPKYTSKKPVAQGGLQTYFWQNDTQVCNLLPPDQCPLTYSMKLKPPTPPLNTAGQPCIPSTSTGTN